MATPLPRRTVLQAGLVLCASVAAPRVRACEYIADGLRILHPWTHATPPGVGVAVLCMGFEDVTADDRLVSVQTPVAERAEMGGPDAGGAVDFPIPAGQSSALSEQGVHVRLVGLRHALGIGRVFPLHLGFERVGLVIATLNVDYMALR